MKKTTEDQIFSVVFVNGPEKVAATFFSGSISRLIDARRRESFFIK